MSYRAEAVRQSNRKLLVRVAELEAQLPNLRGFSDDQLLAELPERTGRVLSVAREVGHEIVQRAERDAAVVRAEAREEAVKISYRAETEARKVLSGAENEAQAQVAAAYSYGKNIIAKARAKRDEILADLTVRREKTQADLETLEAARDRLLEAYLELRRTFEGSTAISVDHGAGPASSPPLEVLNGQRSDSPVDLWTRFFGSRRVP